LRPAENPDDAAEYGRWKVAVSAPRTPFPKYGDHRDRALAARAGRGDEQAFAELYDRHASGLLAFATQYVGDRAAAEDVVQQTFMSAYRVLSEGTELEHPRAWLYHVTRNNSLSVLRDRGPASADAALATDLQDRAAAVPTQVERREDLQAVVRDIVALPAEQRAALALYELGDLSQAEIADALGCKPAKVKALVFQARSSLVTRREARDASCETVREKLATFHGGALNNRLIRHHLRGCAACTAYRDELRDKRRRVALLLPLLPVPALRESVLGLFGGGAAAKTGAAGAAVLLRPGRARWLATGAATTAVVAGLTLTAWPHGDAPRKTSAQPATTSSEPAFQPPSRSAPAPHRKAAVVHHRRAHRARAASAPHVIRAAAPAAVVTPPPPAARKPSQPHRPPAAKHRPAPKPAPPPAPVPVSAPVTQPPPAPAPIVAAAPPPVTPPATTPCADHSHASAQGLAHGQGHHKLC
jgi:RNA polymerase sigma factor (sigma-70 family)